MHGLDFILEILFCTPRAWADVLAHSDNQVLLFFFIITILKLVTASCAPAAGVRTLSLLRACMGHSEFPEGPNQVSIHSCTSIAQSHPAGNGKDCAKRSCLAEHLSAPLSPLES